MLLIKNSFKEILLFLFIFFISINASAQEFKFEKEVIDYGTIDVGSEGDRVFVFTNVGTAPLTIKNIQSTCGCTIPKKPKKAILPGEKGEIKVVYDTKRIGGFSKSITIISNAKNKRKVLRIKGFVKKPVSLEKEKNMLQEVN